VEFKKKKPSDLGVPQGGTVSPILSNIVLHELDKYVADIIAKRDAENKGRKPWLANPIYKTTQDAIKGINRTEERWKAAGKTLDEERKKRRLDLIKQRNSLKSTIPNPGVVKIFYVRYADD